MSPVNLRINVRTLKVSPFNDQVPRQLRTHSSPQTHYRLEREPRNVRSFDWKLKAHLEPHLNSYFRVHQLY